MLVIRIQIKTDFGEIRLYSISIDGLPWVSKRLSTRIPFVSVDTHQLVDEIFRRITYVIPVRRVEFEFTCNIT